jgi:hypothetical protein
VFFHNLKITKSKSKKEIPEYLIVLTNWCLNYLAGDKAPRMSAHGDQTGLLLRRHHLRAIDQLDTECAGTCRGWFDDRGIFL